MSSSPSVEPSNPFMFSLDTSPDGSLNTSIVTLKHIQEVLARAFPETDFSISSAVKQKYKVSSSVAPKLIATLVMVQAGGAKYEYTGIHEFLPSQNTTRVLFEKAGDLSEAQLIREVCFSPSSEALYIFYKNKVDKYSVAATASSSSDSSNYRISDTPILTINLPEGIFISEVISHPSGAYLVAAGQTQDRDSVLLRVTDSDLPLLVNVAAHKCVGAGLFNEGTLDFDYSSEDNFLTAFENRVCSWDGNNLSLVQDSTMVDFSQFVFYGEKIQLEKQQSVFTYIKSIWHPSLIMVVDMSYLCSHFFKKGANSSIEYVFSVRYKEDYNRDPRIQIFAQEIPLLDMVFIYQTQFNVGEFIKVNEINKQALSLLPQQFTEQMTKVFYDSLANRICFIHISKLHCHDFLTKCDDAQNSLPRCIDGCIAKQMYWNAQDWKCSNCQQDSHCSCGEPYEEVNPITGKCQLDCQNVPHAVYDSEFIRNGQIQCFCSSLFQWSPENNACLLPCSRANASTCLCPPGYLVGKFDGQCFVDCSQIKFAEQGYVSNQTQMCDCNEGFEFIKPTKANAIGKCQTVCQHPTSVHWQRGQPYCNCGEQQRWSPRQLSCQAVVSKQGLQGWAVALIVIAVLIALGILVFLFLKKCRKMSGRIKRGFSTGSETKLTDRKINSERNTEPTDPVCRVCDSTGINCEGPCRHEFHFNCIKEKIDMGECECPVCKLPFKNGLSDIRIRQPDDEIFTIEE